MPSLQQVMTREIGEDRFRASGAWRLRDQQVVAVKPATGAPCDGHASAFAPWPGPHRDVKRWYELDSGCAVGIEELEDQVRVQVWDADPSSI